MKLQGGDVDVLSGTGFRAGVASPLVRLTVTPTDGQETVLWMRPNEARRIGQQLIGGAFVSVTDAAIRQLAKDHGLDGDSMLQLQRELLETELP